MSMVNNQGLGLVRRTSSFGRKRILILNHMDFDSIEVATPKKKQFLGSESFFCCERSLLEALPQEILVSSYISIRLCSFLINLEAFCCKLIIFLIKM